MKRIGKFKSSYLFTLSQELTNEKRRLLELKERLRKERIKGLRQVLESSNLDRNTVIKAFDEKARILNAKLRYIDIRQKREGLSDEQS